MDPDLIVVRLLRFPLDVYQRSNEHFEGLKREFALLEPLPWPDADHEALIAIPWLRGEASRSH